MSSTRLFAGAALALAAAALAGCSNAYTGQCQGIDTSQIFVSTAGSGDSCPSASSAAAVSSVFGGKGAPGSACQGAGDCAPVCCACGGSPGVALAVDCLNGRCPTNDELCCGFSAHSSICTKGIQSKSFHTCNSASDCESGLDCIMHYEVTCCGCGAPGVCTCDVSAKICTKPCTADADCSTWNGACTGSSACSGTKDLCYLK